MQAATKPSATNTPVKSATQATVSNNVTPPSVVSPNNNSNQKLVPLQRKPILQQALPHFEIPATTSGYYEKWFLVNNRKQELQYYLRQCADLTRGTFSYQRLKGLDQLQELIHQLLQTKDFALSDRDVFHALHKKMNKDVNVVMAVMYNILKKQASTHFSPVTQLELRKALMVVEGACLLSPACSSTLAQIQGTKWLLRLASEAKSIAEDWKKQQTPATPSSQEEEEEDDSADWDDVRLGALDAFEAAIHNSAHLAVTFCEEMDVDVIINMLRNNLLSSVIRSKCVELICLVLKILFVDEDKNKKAIKIVKERMCTYLSQKICDDLCAMVNKTQQAITDTDMLIFENFAERLDKQRAA